MGVVQYGDVIVLGNFAEVSSEKPADFDYMSDAKWLEDYWLDERERIGGTICSCKKIEVHYAPYYGFDLFHTEQCNLMKKIRDRPQLIVLWAYNHLPAIVFSKQAVPADSHIPMYVRSSSRTHKIKVHRPAVAVNQERLL